ncbi:MAG: deferrochelatase/peroxidase EfeB [Actinomycetota bacterium]|nr:MAG: deferrochelatase/peroxidase EfeB [Actinomycetota bacterium]
MTDIPPDAGTTARPADVPRPGGLSRRRLLGLAGAGVVGAAGLGAAGVAVAAARDGDKKEPAVAEPPVVDFYGEHQAGIVTPAQDRLHFVAFDLVTDDRAAVIGMLKAWTAAAARMTQGHDAGPVGAVSGHLDAPPDDTGEALGLSPSSLTITVGFGPTFFTGPQGRDRFGVAAQRPPALVDLPRFAGDTLDPARSGGDLCVQACADDPQVAVHAVRNLARIAFGVAAVRWSQLGYGRTASTSTAQSTPRNLLGFKDGTMNIKAEDAAGLRDWVWVQPGDGAEWMAGGTYLVARRIANLIETWDRTSLREQEALIGRTKGVGGPLSGGGEFTDLDLARQTQDGSPAIAENAHVRLAHPSSHGGARLLRRGYNFVDGSDGLGRLDAGLFFIAFQRDPRKQFVPIQTALSRFDGLNEYLRHTGSAIFAIPPGVTSGGWIGQTLFG